jgi:agmatine deiminase
MAKKNITIACIFLVVGIVAGYFLPLKFVQWQIEKQTNDYFENNDVNLPFQTYTSFGYENMITSAAPWIKKYWDENINLNIEKTVRKKYAYLFDAAISSPESDTDIANYLKVTGLLNEMRLSVEQAQSKLEKTSSSQNLILAKNDFTKAFMNAIPNFPVRLPAEFEPIQSVFVSFPIFYPGQWKTHTELINSISSEAEAIVLVPNKYWQKAVMLYFETKAIPLANIRFAYINTDDVWTRDYGPTTVVKNNGEKIFIWNNYYEEYNSYHKRSADAASDLGRYFDIPVYRVPLVVEGGNIITDGQGTFIMFNSVLANNPDYDLTKLKKVMKDFYGCKSLILLPLLKDELTGHIDMVVKFVDKNTLMVIESDISYKWHQDFENIAEELSKTKSIDGTNYKIIRLRMPKTDNESVNFWSYINSLTLNGSVIVPLFGVSEDIAALDAYRKAMPNYKVIGIDFSKYPVGSVHCQTKEMYK